MNATATHNQPLSITTRHALAARAAAVEATPVRPSLASRVRSRFAARQRVTPFARLTSSERREFDNTAGVHHRSAPATMRSGLDTFMR